MNSYVTNVSVILKLSVKRLINFYKTIVGYTVHWNFQWSWIFKYKSSGWAFLGKNVISRNLTQLQTEPNVYT